MCCVGKTSQPHACVLRIAWSLRFSGEKQNLTVLKMFVEHRLYKLRSGWLEGLVNYVSKPMGKSGVKRLLLLEVCFITLVWKAVCRLEVLAPGSSPQVEKFSCFAACLLPYSSFSSSPPMHVTGLSI